MRCSCALASEGDFATEDVLLMRNYFDCAKKKNAARFSVYPLNYLRRNPSGSRVILIEVGQKSSTRVI